VLSHTASQFLRSAVHLAGSRLTGVLTGFPYLGVLPLTRPRVLAHSSAEQRITRDSCHRMNPRLTADIASSSSPDLTIRCH
jgi:hypothetical protein